MKFFDETPSGQILNLASKDIDIVDVNFPVHQYTFIFIFLQLLAILIIIAINNILTLPFVIILIVLGYNHYIQFTRSALNLRRMVQLTLAPIITNINEYYKGIYLFR